MPLAVLSLAVVLAGQESMSLMVTGQPGAAKVAQVQGRNYVEIEGLAQLTNGSVRYQGKQIVFTLPGTGTGNAQTDSPQSTGFSKGFLTAGIEAMARAREWHAALRTAIALISLLVTRSQ